MIPLLRTGPRKYTLERNTDIRLHNFRVTIPAGYTTNGITAPGWIRDILGDSVKSPETQAAVFHDWLFTPASPVGTRKEADERFVQYLFQLGVPRWKRWAMGTAVKLYSLWLHLRSKT